MMNVTDQLSRVAESESPELQALGKTRRWSCFFIFDGIGVEVGNQSLFFGVAKSKTHSFLFLEAFLSFYSFDVGVARMEPFRVELDPDVGVVCQTC